MLLFHEAGVLVLWSDTSIQPNWYSKPQKLNIFKVKDQLKDNVKGMSYLCLSQRGILAPIVPPSELFLIYFLMK
jgi:hypothetical protein